MPYASRSLATLRPDLAGGFLEFDLAMEREGFIGLDVLPVFETPTANGNFGRIKLEQLLQDRDTTRTATGGYNRATWDFDPDSYVTAEHGAEEPVDDKEEKMYANYFDLEMVSAGRAFDAVLRGQERRTAAKIFDPTVWTGGSLTAAVAAPWTKANVDSATPIDDINNGRTNVWQNCGLWPNALILNRFVFNQLRTMTQVKENIMARGAGFPVRARDITREQLAAVFDVDYVLVAGSARNTANEAKARVLTPIWSSSYVGVARLCTSTDIREPGIGRTFHWGEDGSTIGGTFETYRDEVVRGDVVRVRNQTDEHLLYKECQFLLSGVLG